MKRFRLALVAGTIACLVLPCYGAASKSPEGGFFVLARVNGEEITGGDMIEEFSSRHAGHAKFLGGTEEARRFLKVLIEDRLFLQEAYLLGLDEHPEAKALVSRHVELESADVLIRREVQDKAGVTQKEIREIWESKLDVVLGARQIAVERRNDAEAIRAAILSGVDPEYFARTCSIADSSRNGGKVLIAWGTLEEALESVVSELEAGELSPVIETSEGYEVIHVIDRIAVSRPELGAITSRIEGVLKARKLEKRKSDFSDELWSRYAVAIEPLDFSPQALLPLRLTAPETLVATWDGGSLKLRDMVEPEDLRDWAGMSSKRGRVEVEKRLRMTVNAPLTVLEARRRGIPAEAEFVAATEHYQDLVVRGLLFRDHVYRAMEVTKDESLTYFREHRTEFRQPERRRVAHVMVGSEEEAKRIRQELEAGAEFGAIAKAYSRDFSSALSGGDLGFITAANVPPSFEAVLSLDEGEISEPLKGENSKWHLVKVLEISPERFLDYEEVKDKLEEAVLNSKKREATAYWLERLRAAAEIEIDDEAIAQFVKENEMESFDAPAPGHEVPAGAIQPH